MNIINIIQMRAIRLSPVIPDSFFICSISFINPGDYFLVAGARVVLLF